MDVTFIIPGRPTGKGRPIVTKNGTFTPQRTVMYENLVKTEYERQCAGKRFDDDSPLCMVVCAKYAPPRSATAKMRKAMLDGDMAPTKKPDADNIAKAIADSLNGIAYRDDAQIVQLIISKVYAEAEEVVVKIWGFEHGKVA